MGDIDIVQGVRLNRAAKFAAKFALVLETSAQILYHWQSFAELPDRGGDTQNGNNRC